MMLCDDLKDRVWQQIEDRADPTALARLRDALACIADPTHRAALEDAAIQLAGAWADSALVIGWTMRADPGAWLFVEE